MTKHKAYLTPDEAGYKKEVSKEKYLKWHMLPYTGGKYCHRDLQLDHFFPNDRDELVYFLMVLYDNVAKATGISIKNCDFKQSMDLHSRCNCELCKKLWGAWDRNHKRFKCKHCGIYYYIRKDCYDMNVKKGKNKYRVDRDGKKIKYNVLDYCHSCGQRLQILDPEIPLKQKHW